MLAGDGAAESHAELEDLDAEALGALPLAFPVGVEKNQRVEVAVAGVEDVEALESILLLHRLDGSQHRPERLARYGAVHAVVVGREAPCGGEGVLPPRP